MTELYEGIVIFPTRNKYLPELGEEENLTWAAMDETSFQWFTGTTENGRAVTVNRERRAHLPFSLFLLGCRNSWKTKRRNEGALSQDMREREEG